MKALNLPSEASTRFSREIHPELVKPAAERALELMRQHTGGTVSRGVVDNYPAPVPPQITRLEMGEVRRLLGIDLPVAEALRILRALEFQVEQLGPETLEVTTPPHRRDIQEGSADLIEDLVRIYGYDRLPATLLAEPLPRQHGNRALALEEKVRDILARAGLQEVITYSLTTPKQEEPLGLANREYVTLQNPISSERVVMRHSLLSGMLEVAHANLDHTADVRLFEVGPVFLPRRGEKLPDEPRRLGLFMTGRRQPEFWESSDNGQEHPLDFYDIKGVIQALACDLHISEVSYRPTKAAYLHPGRAAELVIAGRAVGSFGQMHPQVAEQYKLGDRAVLAGELDLEAILAAVPVRYEYAQVPQFPPALRDIAVIVAEAVSCEQVVAEMRAAGGELLRQARLFDLYRGSSIPEGTKSLAFALTYQAQDRTLTDKEIDRVHKKIEDRLKHVLKAQIRGQEK
jgi:phenylalanyl-tRNA synthetase beta chain